MKYGIIGTGAIGGYYGAKLAKAGFDVHFLLHRDYDYVMEHGLQVNSCRGNFHLDRVNAYNEVLDMPKCDVVIVALKTVNESLLRTLLPPLLTSHTIVLLIQNGIGVEEDVQKMFPDTFLAAGLAFICSAKISPGVIDHQDYGSINIGNYSCRDEDNFTLLLSDLKAAEVECHAVEYNEARWQKAVWNMPFNGMTVALDTETDRLLANPFTEKLIYDLMIEVIEAANACGVNTLTHEFANRMIDMTKAMTPYSPSMKLDYVYHRSMEIYYLYTRPIEIARAAGYEMKKLSMLEAELRFLEEKNLR
jgi:2-dehydropantoate 2-reductase